MQNMFFILLAAQFLIQYVLYRQIRFTLYWCMSAADDIFNGDMVVIKKTAWIVAIISNVGISLLVKYFTAAGSIAGISNLTASVVLGLFMAYDLNKFMKLIKSSRTGE